MKTAIASLAALSLTLAACSPKQEEAAPATGASTNAESSSGNPLTAPVDYLGAVGKAKKSMANTLEMVQVNQAIQQFEGLEGRHPKSLNELVSQGYLARLPNPPAGYQFTYDPATGKAALEPK